MATPTTDDLVAAGLYDPAASDADRLALLRWLVDRGFELDELSAASASGTLASIASDRRLVPGERLTRTAAIERTGLDPDTFDAYVTALGYESVSGSPPGEVGITEDDVELLATIQSLTGLFTRDEGLGLIRVFGSALARIAEATVSLFLVDVESTHVRRGGNEYELARKVYDAVQLVDGLGARLDPALRRHMLQAAERTRATAIDEVERVQYRYAVGFVDLVGFTTMSRHMSAQELSEFVGRFDRTAHDVVTGAGARVVKLIGDEVMFVAANPTDAVEAGRALIRTFATTADAVRPRGGLAFGSVVLRGGDYYGSVVNLASRLADAAVPGEVLATEELTKATSIEFEPAGRRMIKGFDEPVVVASLPI